MNAIRWQAIGGPVLGILLLALAWQMSAVGPGPAAVLLRGWSLMVDGTLPGAMLVTLGPVVRGVAIGGAAGVVLGLLLGLVAPVRSALAPWVGFLRFVPAVAVVALVMAWGGTGVAGSVAPIAYGAAVLVALATVSGLASVGAGRVRAAQCLGASSAQVFRLVSLPAGLPAILDGLRVATMGGFAVVVVAGLVGAEGGLGGMLWNAQRAHRMDDVVVVLAALGVLGLLVDGLFQVVSRLLAGRFNAAA